MLIAQLKIGFQLILEILHKNDPHNKSHIAGSTGEIQDLGVLVCDALQQELFHQSLRVSVTHDSLALIEVLQVLQGQKVVMLATFFSQNATVGQWSKSFVLYSVLVVEPNMYIIMKFWMLYCFPPGCSSWSI